MSSTGKLTKAKLKEILHSELLKYADSHSYAELEAAALKGTVDNYEIKNDAGIYQVRVEPYIASSGRVLNLLGALDGPGVFHFGPFHSSVTDQVVIGDEDREE